MSRHIMLTLAFLVSSGCAALRDPNQIMTFDSDKSRVFITQADRRAIFTFPSRAAYACPEPSPDVKANVEAAVKALADVNAKTSSDLSGAAKVELDTTRKLLTASLLQRSQGLQVLRDMLFQACLANLRGDMDPKAYASFVTGTLPNLTTTLITAEMVTKTNGDKAVLQGEDLKSFLQFVLANTYK
jgi:hypothetical protein